MQAQTRPGWDRYFHMIARAVSERASCPRAKVGAVIVDVEHRILSTGYNGAPSGERDCLSYGCNIEGDHCQRAIHAEVNAVAYAARAGISIKGSTLYVYSSRGDRPCRECLKVLTAAGVRLSQEG